MNNLTKLRFYNIAKKNFDINRIRLTLGDAKGKAMSDKRTTLS